MVTLALAAKLLVIRLRPSAPPARLVGELVECLTDKLGTSTPHADATSLAAAAGHRSDAAIGLHFFGLAEPLALAAHRRQQPRRQRFARPGQRTKYGGVFVLGKRGVKLLLKFSDGLVELFDLLDQQADVQRGRFDDRRVLSKMSKRANLLNLLFDLLVVTLSVLSKKLLQRFRIGTLQFHQRRPAAEQFQGQRTMQRTDQIHRLWEVKLQHAAEPLGLTFTGFHDFSPQFAMRRVSAVSPSHGRS